MREIVVMGCGLAGYHAARRLEQRIAGRRRVRLTVINDRAHFVFSPLLPAVAAGQLEPDHVTAPLDQLFEPRTRTIIDRVHTIDINASRLIAGDHTIEFDYLLVATGTVPSPRAFDGAAAVPGPHSLDQAVQIRDRLQNLDPEDLSSGPCIVVGGSTTGVQWAAQLARWASEASPPKDHRPRVQLYEARQRLLPDHSRRLARKVKSALRRQGVAVRTGHSVDAADPGGVTLDDGSTREASMVFHCAGGIGTDPVIDSGIAVDDRGLIEVDAQLGIPGVVGAFGAGDAVRGPDTSPADTNPQIARQQGRWAARNLLATMSGQAPRPFQYEDRGDFITLGAGDTVLELGGVHLEGRPAWLAYRLYYTALMPQAIQKLRLLRDWIGRSLTGDGRLPIGRRLTDDD